MSCNSKRYFVHFRFHIHIIITRSSLTIPSTHSRLWIVISVISAFTIHQSCFRFRPKVHIPLHKLDKPPSFRSRLFSDFSCSLVCYITLHYITLKWFSVLKKLLNNRTVFRMQSIMRNKNGTRTVLTLFQETSSIRAADDVVWQTVSVSQTARIYIRSYQPPETHGHRRWKAVWVESPAARNEDDDNRRRRRSVSAIRWM